MRAARQSPICLPLGGLRTEIDPSPFAISTGA
jgi:hypothetical protein